MIKPHPVDSDSSELLAECVSDIDGSISDRIYNNLQLFDPRVIIVSSLRVLSVFFLLESVDPIYLVCPILGADAHQVTQRF